METKKSRFCTAIQRRVKGLKALSGAVIPYLYINSAVAKKQAELKER